MEAGSERSYAMGMHLTGISSIIGIPGIIGPLVMWLIKKDESPFIDAGGKTALNFHLTMLIAYVVSAILVIVLIGFVLLPVVFILEIVFSIIAAVKANNGEHYQYPLSIPFFK